MGKKEVLVLDADQDQSKNLMALLVDHQYRPVALNSLIDIERYTRVRDCRALILNLDNVSVTNKVIKDIKRQKPLLDIVALSERQFHPELKEAIRDHISVCLGKPVDPDELLYWLKSIFENDDGPAG